MMTKLIKLIKDPKIAKLLAVCFISTHKQKLCTHNNKRERRICYKYPVLNMSSVLSELAGGAVGQAGVGGGRLLAVSRLLAALSNVHCTENRK